jgi:uncharacterized OB-fold protein
MSHTISADSPPLVPYIKRAEGGRPFIAGSKCGACGSLFIGERKVCAKCTARDQMTATEIAETGKLYVFTVVHRSFPGVETPFVDAIVDMDDGSHLKGTLAGVKADPDAITFGLPVKLAWRDADPPNMPGKPHLTYYFVPA